MNEQLALCAQANFENLERAVPQLSKHPYWLIAKAQLDEALGGKPVEETLKPHIREFNIPVGECSELAHCFVGHEEKCVCGKTSRAP